MRPDEFAIRITGLSKRYEVYDSPRDRLKQFILPRFQNTPKQYFRDFWAVYEASFDVKKGETVGIIGRNGSGKSTILKMICGTVSPTNGEIRVNGRVAALLELGAGFNPEYTGRENAYLQGVVLGLSKDEIDSRMSDIIEFAEIGGFIDQPVKAYSSGMTIRLAFAVIAHVNADILIIDEALAVGDVFFQQKCMRFLNDFRANRGTILFVSHDSAAVLSLCDRAILLAAGSLIFNGDTRPAIKRFLEDIYSDPNRQPSRDAVVTRSVESEVKAIHDGKHVFQGAMNQKTEYIVSEFRENADHFGNGAATITDAGFFEENYQKIYEVKGEQTVNFFIRANVYDLVTSPAFGFMIKNKLGEYVFAEGTDIHFRKDDLVFSAGDVATAIFTFTMPHLACGTYTINVAFAEGQGDVHIQHSWLHDAIQLDVTSSRLKQGYCGLDDIRMTLEVLSSEKMECQ